tara:strand:- start:1267 stop:2061 length:795 start_codon:yes stop_codon:yes gene_type:complete
MAVLLGSSVNVLTIPIYSSVTWTPPYNGTGVIHCIGAGGAGFDHTSNTYAGGAGGYCQKAVSFATGTDWTLVVGAGGSGAGGETTATDGTHALDSNGGTASSGNAGGSGGTASGGDTNRTGGAGALGGGGAVGVFGTGEAGTAYRAGSSDARGPSFDSAGVLSGGGVGGTKGENEGTSTSQNYNTPSGVRAYGVSFGGGRLYGPDGGFLSGGGSIYANDSGAGDGFGGYGGIGGGGGGTRVSPGTGRPGFGGDGMILIQYLTVG